MSTSPVLRRQPAQSAAGWSQGIAILFILAGIFAMVLPMVSGIAITLFVGWILLLVGCLHFLFAWRGGTTGSKLWELLLGIVYVFSGIYLIAHPIAGLTSLTLILAVYLFFKGVLEVIQYFQLQPRRGVIWLVLDGIINLVLAVIIWRSWPFSSVWVIGTLIGISIIFAGISRLALGYETRRALTV